MSLFRDIFDGAQKCLHLWKALRAPENARILIRHRNAKRAIDDTLSLFGGDITITEEDAEIYELMSMRMRAIRLLLQRTPNDPGLIAYREALALGQGAAVSVEQIEEWALYYGSEPFVDWLKRMRIVIEATEVVSGVD